jgi:nitroreductase
MGGNLGSTYGFIKVGLMEFSQLVRSRRTVHNYLPEKVSEELVVEALRLSLWAPNHKLTFPWSYTLVGPVARERIADLALELKIKKDAQMSDLKKRLQRESVLTPSHVVSFGIRLSEPKQEHEDTATVAASIYAASLFLWDNGISTKWTTSGWSKHARTYEILGLNPSEVRLEGCLLIGKPAVVPALHERPPLDSFLRRVE